MQAAPSFRQEALGPFGRRIVAHRGELPAVAQRELLRLEQRPRQSWRAGSQLTREGGDRRVPQILAVGWAARQRELGDGRRQILELLAPGDIINLQASEMLVDACTSVVALTAVKTIEVLELLALIEQGAANALCAPLKGCLAENQHFIEQSLIRLGRQTAYERMAHLLMELDWRLARRGLSMSGAYALPLTQMAIADALGLSVVHVNRTLQQMRKEGAIEFHHGKVELLNKAALSQACEFREPVFAGFLRGDNAAVTASGKAAL